MGRVGIEPPGGRVHRLAPRPEVVVRDGRGRPARRRRACRAGRRGCARSRIRVGAASRGASAYPSRPDAAGLPRTVPALVRRAGGHRPHTDRLEPGRLDAARGRGAGVVPAHREGIGLRGAPDGAGSLWAVTPDADDGPWVCAGSHLDTQPDGGAYDGALGVVARSRRRPRCSSPASRASIRWPWSRSSTRRVRASAPPASPARRDRGRLDIDARARRHGRRTRDLRRHPRVAARKPRPSSQRVGCFLEVHVEQGTSLVDRGLALGVADVLAPRQRWRVEFAGESNHAGTTPMAGRRDALRAGRAVRARGRRGGAGPAGRRRHGRPGRGHAGIDQLDPRPGGGLARRARARVGHGRRPGGGAARPLPGRAHQPRVAQRGRAPSTPACARPSSPPPRRPASRPATCPPTPATTPASSRPTSRPR